LAFDALRGKDDATMKFRFALLGLFALPTTALAQTSSPTAAATDDSNSATAVEAVHDKDVRREVPVVAYTYGAAGVSAKTIGVQAYGVGLAARGQNGILGGGGAFWGSPVDRLTIVVDGQRNLARDFSPSAAAIVRLYGDGRQGLTLGALGKFKIEGFGKGPDGEEVESEVEIGGLLAIASAGWHLDANAIAGRGLGDEGEMDTEGRLRLGRDFGNWARLGIDGQMRVRVAGPLTLPNRRSWDFAAGPQFLAYSGNFFGAVTTGPTTMGLVSENIGWTAMLSVGGTTF
jgi:hypothetical protein